MKRFLCFLMVACSFMLVLSTAVAAPKFDASVFANIDNISVDADDMEGVVYIDMPDRKPCFFDPGYSDNYYCSFFPSVRIDSEGIAVLRFFCYFYGKDEALIDQIIIKVGDNRYTFKDVNIDSSVQEHAETRETLGIIFSSEHLSFLQDFVQNSTKSDVKVRLCGDKYNIDFTMSESMVEWLNRFLTLYDQAGGLNTAYLEQIPTLNAMTVK